MENVIIDREYVRPVKLTARHSCGGYLIANGAVAIRKVGDLFEVYHQCSKCSEIVWLDRPYPAIDYESVQEQVNDAQEQEVQKNYRFVTNLDTQTFEVSASLYKKLTVHIVHRLGTRITGTTKLMPVHEFTTAYLQNTLTVEVLRSEKYIEDMNGAGILYCFGPLPDLSEFDFDTTYNYSNASRPVSIDIITIDLGDRRTGLPPSASHLLNVYALEFKLQGSLELVKVSHLVCGQDFILMHHQYNEIVVSVMRTVSGMLCDKNNNIALLYTTGNLPDNNELVKRLEKLVGGKEYGR